MLALKRAWWLNVLLPPEPPPRIRYFFVGHRSPKCQAVRHKRARVSNRRTLAVLDGLATSVYLPMFKHLTQIPPQTGLVSSLHSRVHNEPARIFGHHWRCQRYGTDGLLQSNQSSGGDSIESGQPRSIPGKNRDDLPHRPAPPVGNSHPLFSTGSHAERSVLRSVAPRRNPNFRGSSDLSAQYQRPRPAAVAAKRGRPSVAVRANFHHRRQSMFCQFSQFLRASRSWRAVEAWRSRQRQMDRRFREVDSGSCSSEGRRRGRLIQWP